VTVAAIMAGGGILIILTVIIGRWLDARSWSRSLSAIRLTLPVGLSGDDVARWLNTIAAATQAPRLALLPEPPIALEVVATRDGFDHMLLVPTRLRPTVLSGLRAALPGVRLSDDPDYGLSRPSLGIAGELGLGA
jgi:hypothetical protein